MTGVQTCALPIYIARRGLEYAGDHLQKRGFARTVQPDDPVELTLMHGEGNIAQRVKFLKLQLDVYKRQQAYSASSVSTKSARTSWHSRGNTGSSSTARHRAIFTALHANGRKRS